MHARPLTEQSFPWWFCQVSEARCSHTKLMLASCKSLHLSPCFPLYHLSVMYAHLWLGVWIVFLGCFCWKSGERSGGLNSCHSLPSCWKRASSSFLTCNAECRLGYLESCLPRCFSLKPHWLLPDYRSALPEALSTLAHAWACTETSVNKVSLTSDSMSPGPKTQIWPPGTHNTVLC